MEGMEHAITQHWDPETILLSYCIAVTGSYCTIQLMEQWRLQESRRGKLVLLILSSIALGGCGIWCMHFTGMRALHMDLDDGTRLEVHFEGGMTVLSLIFPIVGVFIGLKIGSTDPFFLEVEASRRKELLGKNLKKVKMEDMVKRENIHRKIKSVCSNDRGLWIGITLYVALLSRPWHIIGGGFFAAVGVLGMHYLGMLAQRTNAKMAFHFDIVLLSSVIAFITANAAFWILFRALTFWPNFESLRFGSALIMGVAVCGTHYSGMCAATYEYDDEDFTRHTRFLFNGERAANIASHASLFVCFWLSTFAVMVSIRKNLFASARSNKSGIQPEPRSMANNNTTINMTKGPPQPRANQSRRSQGPSEGGVQNNNTSLAQLKELVSCKDSHQTPQKKVTELVPASPVWVHPMGRWVVL